MIYVEYLVLILLGYLLGAIPSGLIAGKLLKGIDIRQYGSGKVGATNTLRTLGWGPSAVVFLSDVIKAAGPVLLARWITGSPTVEVLVAMAAVIGHNWPAYIGWRGGRGVSSTFGASLVFSPLAAAVATVVFVTAIAWSRYVSLGSILGSLIGCLTMVGLVVWADLPLPYGAFAVAGTLLIVVQHRDNMVRLWRGTERKLGQTAQTSG